MVCNCSQSEPSGKSAGGCFGAAQRNLWAKPRQDGAAAEAAHPPNFVFLFFGGAEGNHEIHLRITSAPPKNKKWMRMGHYYKQATPTAFPHAFRERDLCGLGGGTEIRGAARQQLRSLLLRAI
jgi:hypothetical protein